MSWTLAATLIVGVFVPALVLPVSAAAQTGTATADALIKQLAGDKDMATRARAARDLGAMNAKQAIPALVAALRDPVAMVRSYAIASLARLASGSEPVAVALAGALADPDQGVRDNAAIALGQLGPVSRVAIPALEKNLADPWFNARLSAAFTLDHLAPAKASRVLAVLAATMKVADQNRRVEAAGLLVLEDLARAEVRQVILDGLAHGAPDVRKVIAQGLAAANMSADVARPYVPALQAALSHPDEGVQLAAKEALRRLGQ
jgi:HEAT repeat protein